MQLYRYTGNEITNISAGTSAERMGVRQGWRIAVVRLHRRSASPACMLASPFCALHLNFCGTRARCARCGGQVNGTAMPSGHGAEHAIHEHIGGIKKRDERIVVEFEVPNGDGVTLTFESFVTKVDLKKALRCA